jgi:holo-[acyl-carrier protein] synthase
MSAEKISAGLGIDVVDVPRFARLLERWGDRLLERLFTPDERASCARTARPPVHLAARFAAKEAIVKALGGGAASWREIEVPRRPGRGVEANLKGRIARRLGRRRLLISLTHTERTAAAVAMVVPNR